MKARCGHSLPKRPPYPYEIRGLTSSINCWRVVIKVGEGPEQRTRVHYYTKRSEAREIARKYKGTVSRCPEKHA